MKRILKYTIAAAMLLSSVSAFAQAADKNTYLKPFIEDMKKKWPHNRTLNIVFHGHSVPTGYAITPVVNSLEAYPHKLFTALKSHYQTAVINVITTSIGGEQSEKGETRFKSEVLTHRPDVLFIDYAVNDRNIGLERSEKAWRKMIEAALKKDIFIVLLTPTPDLNEDILSDTAPLELHSQMIRRLAEEYNIGLVDSYARFKERAKQGENLMKYMSQKNHPNPAGHSIVAADLISWFY